jgi:hypothetical protein
MAIEPVIVAVTSTLGSGGVVALFFGRRLQKAQTESVLVQASGDFVQSVSDQMQRMEVRMKELEVGEQQCQNALRTCRLRLIKLEEQASGDGK